MTDTEIKTNYEAAKCYPVYLALHATRKDAPEIFTDRRCTIIMTALLGSHPWSWKVVGITREALVQLTASDYVILPKSGLTRAHLIPRIDTCRKLLSCSNPKSISELVSIWIENDRTVLCAKGQNRKMVPNFIEFNIGSEILFPNAQVGWRHTKREREFLREIAKHASL